MHGSFSATARDGVSQAGLFPAWLLCSSLVEAPVDTRQIQYVCTSAGIANAAAAVRLKPISWRPSTSHTKVGVTWPMTTTWWCS